MCACARWPPCACVHGRDAIVYLSEAADHEFTYNGRGRVCNDVIKRLKEVPLEMERRQLVLFEKFEGQLPHGVDSVHRHLNVQAYQDIRTETHTVRVHTQVNVARRRLPMPDTRARTHTLSLYARGRVLVCMWLAARRRCRAR